MDKATLGLISGVINAVSIVPYVYVVIRGEARPNRVTWSVWLLLSWTIFFASAASGADTTLFWLASAAFNSTIVFVLSLWKGVWEKSALELWALSLGLIGILLWYATKKAFYSVYISSLVDAAAIVPTVKKVWNSPASEPKLAWSIGFIAATLNVLAIDSLKPVIWIPPLVVIGWHLAVLIPIYMKKRTKPRAVRVS